MTFVSVSVMSVPLFATLSAPRKPNPPTWKVRSLAVKIWTGFSTLPAATVSAPEKCAAPVSLNCTRTLPLRLMPGMPTTSTFPVALIARRPAAVQPASVLLHS